jgi:hypothetical protein
LSRLLRRLISSLVVSKDVTLDFGVKAVDGRPSSEEVNSHFAFAKALNVIVWSDQACSGPAENSRTFFNRCSKKVLDGFSIYVICRSRAFGAAPLGCRNMSIRGGINFTMNADFNERQIVYGLLDLELDQMFKGSAGIFAVLHLDNEHDIQIAPSERGRVGGTYML